MADFNKIVVIPTGGGNPSVAGPTDSITLTVGSITVNGTSLLRYFQQALIGPLNGFNLVFTTSTKFFASGPSKECLHYNGVVLYQGLADDYTVSESGGVGTGFDTITMAFAPRANDRLSIDLSPSA